MNSIFDMPGFENSFGGLLIYALIVIFAAIPLLCKVVSIIKRDLLFGAIALRWSMRYIRNDFTGYRESVADCYNSSFGHSRKVTSIMSGKYHSIPVSIFDYTYELGCKCRRIVQAKTVFSAELGMDLPRILFVPESKLLPISDYANFSKIDIIKSFPSIVEHNALLSHFSKCHIYTDQPYMVADILNLKILELISEIKSVSLEVQRNNITIWTSRIYSHLLLVKHIGHTIRIARALKDNN